MFTSRLVHAFFAVIVALSPSLVEPVDISLAVDGVGRMTVPGSAEPVDVILQFAREAARRGHVLMKNHEYLTRMLGFFCVRRACSRTLPKSIKVQVENRQLVIEPWEEPADQLEHFVSQLSGRKREVANNLASLLPQICQKTPCFRTELDWLKSLDVESTTIDWKRISVGKIRRHQGRFNSSMESHLAAAEIGDACAMPFFLDSASINDSTTGCLLNASIVLGFARHGGYSGEILRRHIIHGLRDTGAMPMPQKTQLPLSFLRTVHKELAVWLVHHSVISTLHSAESDERQSSMASSPAGQALIVGDDHLTYKYLLENTIVVRLQRRNTTSQHFVPVRIVTLPINFSFHWESFWATDVTSIDASICTYCTKVALNSLSVQNDAGDINELGGALLHELLNEGGAHYRELNLNWDQLAIVTESAGFLAENFMNFCMEEVGETVNRGLWDLGQAREHREIINECGHEGLLRSIPISQDLRSIIPSAIMALRLDSGTILRIPDEGRQMPDSGYAFFYEGERPDVVASDLCELFGPQQVITGWDLNCTLAQKHTCCTEQIATRFKSYKSCTRDSYGIHSDAENAHLKRIRQFQPREYLHVCKSDTDIHSYSLLAPGGQIPNLMANTTAALIPGTRRFCARMFNITEDQLHCQKKVLGSTLDLLAGQINTNPRIMNSHGFVLGRQDIHGRGTCQFRESHSIKLKSTVCKSEQHWDIVVSRCKESVLWLAQFIQGMPACVKKVSIHLYEKCNNDRVLLEKLKIDLGLTDGTNLSERVVSIKSKVLPNIGFEAHTYLYHILRQLKKQTKPGVQLNDSGSNAFSADHTFFLQGNPMDHGQRRDAFFTKAHTLPFHPQTRDYASLTGKYCIAPVNPFFCRVYDFLFRSAGVAETKAETNRAECSGTLGFYALSSFFASRRAIQNRPISFYQRALNLILGAHGRKSTSKEERLFLSGFEWARMTKMHAFFGDPLWTRSFASGKVMTQHFERIWHLIFSADNTSMLELWVRAL